MDRVEVAQLPCLLLVRCWSEMAFTEQLEAATKPGPDRKIPGAVVIAANADGLYSKRGPCRLVNHHIGKILHLDAKGYTSVVPEEAKPITPDTTFWIASCTKLLTTIAALQCVERGQLELDADISTILPEWTDPSILSGFDESTGAPRLSNATKKITLRHLLTHSSGMGYDFLSVLLKRWREFQKEAVGPAKGDIVSEDSFPF